MMHGEHRSESPLLENLGTETYGDEYSTYLVLEAYFVLCLENY